MQLNRTKKATRNIVISFIGYVCVVLSGFIARSVMLKYMGIEMVGVGQLFSNIFMMLSYSSLGLETAIIYSLYEPLEHGDENKICVIMEFYKKCFRYIATCIITLTIVLLPLIPYFVKKSEDMEDIYLILILYGLTAATSYIYAFKRSIIIADQDRYLSTLFTDVFSILKLILQIYVIATTHSYILYMFTNVMVVLSNILAAFYIDMRYPYLKNKNKGEDIGRTLSKEESIELTKTTGALIEQKLGFVFIYAVDSVLMSTFVGVSLIGIYSNYLIVINGLQAGIIIIFQSVIAGIGNIAVTEENQRLKQSWELLNFISQWIYGFSSICLFVLFNPFIKIWIGDEYIFSQNIVFLIILYFYLGGMRKPVIACKDATGMQWKDRYKPLAEVLLNVGISLLLVSKLGIVGIFLGMNISMILTSCWIEPFVFCKYGIKSSFVKYFVDYCCKFLVILFTGAVTYIITGVFTRSFSGIEEFAVKMLLCCIVPNIIFGLIYWRTEKFREVKEIVKRILTHEK